MISSHWLEIGGWRTCVVFITVRNEVAKVMFLQVSVCPRGGGRGGLPQRMLGYPTPGAGTPPLGPDPPGSRHPPRSRHPPGTRPPRSRHPPWPTATVADSMHPTGMHSCYTECFTLDLNGVKEHDKWVSDPFFRTWQCSWWCIPMGFSCLVRCLYMSGDGYQFRFWFRRYRPYGYIVLCRTLHTTESKSDSNPNCPIQEWDRNMDLWM